MGGGAVTSYSALETKFPAEDVSIIQAPSVIADSAPLASVEDFNSTLRLWYWRVVVYTDGSSCND